MSVIEKETKTEFWYAFNEYIEKTSIMPGNVPRMFRGVSDKSYELIPSIGRGTRDNTDNKVSSLENDLIEEFKRLSIPVLEQYPTSAFEWLFLAQHYGLPTRLLDWSSNPLVALFFAIENDNNDGAIYVVGHEFDDQYELFDHKTADVNAETKNNEPRLNNIIALQQDIGKFIFVRPKYTDQRYLNQKSIFSCHANPFESLDLLGTTKFIIKKEWKRRIRAKLDLYGITHSFIYPGLDGVARELRIRHYDPVQKGTATHTTL
ncbi:FRG domain-containing protein [Candidatus Parabeggiatoa sp. HSG14]|uniref:FRG domain-containing protein n=1 Tax=Candidatus Parabeggiatoa sp. HSG14 TaxID=3055593 RepID=UPI0025A78545|nr:FRG domain-containing protein [Thiotrichales bacterium HSG14]